MPLSFTMPPSTVSVNLKLIFLSCCVSLSGKINFPVAPGCFPGIPPTTLSVISRSPAVRFASPSCDSSHVRYAPAVTDLIVKNFPSLPTVTVAYSIVSKPRMSSSDIEGSTTPILSTSFRAMCIYSHAEKRRSEKRTHDEQDRQSLAARCMGQFYECLLPATGVYHQLCADLHAVVHPHASELQRHVSLHLAFKRILRRDDGDEPAVNPDEARRQVRELEAVGHLRIGVFRRVAPGQMILRAVGRQEVHREHRRLATQQRTSHLALGRIVLHRGIG